MANLGSSLKHLLGFLGRECIYKENGVLLHVQLLGIAIKADMLELKFKRLSTPGFSRRSMRTFTWSCVSEFISFRANRINSSLIGSEIFFRPSEVKELVEFMATIPDDGAFIQKVRTYRKD
jgi:hypothetical protein